MKDSDYRQKIRAALRGAMDIVKRIVTRNGDQMRYEDEDGRVHFYRKPSWNPTPAPVPDPQPVPVPIPQPAPVPSGVYGRVLRNYEWSGVSRPELIGSAADGLPDTLKAKDSEWVTLGLSWQTASFDALYKSLVASGMPDNDATKAYAVNLFRKVYRTDAFKTNKHAAEDGFANYVTNENTLAHAMQTEVILTGGAIVAILDYPNKTNVGRVPCYKVAMLDVHAAPPRLDEWDGKTQTPWIYFATTSNRANHGSLEIPLTGGPNIPILNVANRGYAYFEAARIQVLQPGAPWPSPYNE